ncbi:hypothetical protein ASD72_16985 [Pseudoxanthomonas sp. Root630]|nr:hypothetical protein ASD72_16985 [Pseudoxanthomonas sp. Root630]
MDVRRVAHFGEYCMHKGMACLWVLAGWLPAWFVDAQPAESASAPTRNGMFIVDVEPYSSAKPLSRKVARQLDGAALEWGIHENQVVFSFLGTRFVDFPLDRAARYGRKESLELPAGDYRVTGVGLEMTTSYTADLLVNRGAFVNEGVVTFRIEPGRTTSLVISPVIQRDTTMNIDFWMPTLMARVRTDGSETQAVALNVRSPASIAWPAYDGPLKRAVE